MQKKTKLNCNLKAKRKPRNKKRELEVSNAFSEKKKILRPKVVQIFAFVWLPDCGLVGWWIFAHQKLSNLNKVLSLEFCVSLWPNTALCIVCPLETLLSRFYFLN